MNHMIFVCSTLESVFNIYLPQPVRDRSYRNLWKWTEVKQPKYATLPTKTRSDPRKLSSFFATKMRLQLQPLSHHWWSTNKPSWSGGNFPVATKRTRFTVASYRNATNRSKLSLPFQWETNHGYIYIYIYVLIYIYIYIYILIIYIYTCKPVSLGALFCSHLSD